MQMPDGWYGVAAPTELILEFLRVFSRFEYALKVTGFLKGDENDPKPAWDCFAREVSTDFDLVWCGIVKGNSGQRFSISSTTRQRRWSRQGIAYIGK